MESANNFVKVNFFRQKAVNYGESVYIVGSIPNLGCWNPHKALRLTWHENDNWQGEIFIEAPSEFEYKYFTSSSDQNVMPYVNWETGSNVKVTVFPKEYHSMNEASNEINVMSFNVRFDTPQDRGNAWSFRKELVANVIKLNACDFIGVQEPLFSQLADLQYLLPSHTWYGRGREEGSEQGEFSPIFYLRDKWEVEDGSTFWLSDTPNIPGSRTYGNRCPRICTWARFRNRINGKYILIYNCHLDHESSNAQKKAAEQIKNHIARNCKDLKHIVLMGDLNVTPTNEVVKIMKEQDIRLNDTFSLKEKGPEGTFHQWTGNSKSYRIDYIFATESFSVKEYCIIRDSFKKKYPSDHFPIRTKLSM